MEGSCVTCYRHCIAECFTEQINFVYLFENWLPRGCFEKDRESIVCLFIVLTSRCAAVSSRCLRRSRYWTTSRCSWTSSGDISKKQSSTTDVDDTSRWWLWTMRLTWLLRLRIDRPSAVSVVNTTWTCFGHNSGSHDRLCAPDSDASWSRPSISSTNVRCGLSSPATRSSVAAK